MKEVLLKIIPWLALNFNDKQQKNMKLLLYILIIIKASYLLVGCTTVPKLSPQQRRALQVRHFENSYNNVFRSFKTVLQDEGYIIKNQDMEGGLIVAQASKQVSRGFWNYAAAFTSGLSGRQSNDYRTGTSFEVSVNLEEVRKNYVQSRVIIQQVDSYNRGGLRGQEVVSPEMYKNIYSKVRTEIARREVQNR